MKIDQEAREKINIKIAHLKRDYHEIDKVGIYVTELEHIINSIPVYDSPEFKEAPL